MDISLDQVLSLSSVPGFCFGVLCGVSTLYWGINKGLIVTTREATCEAKIAKLEAQLNGEKEKRIKLESDIQPLLSLQGQLLTDAFEGHFEGIKESNKNG